MSDQWYPDFCSRSPIFDHLRAFLPATMWRDWPHCHELQALIRDSVTTCSGHCIRFTAQDRTLPRPDLSYEQRIFQTGLVSTRQSNWHDFFNALIWRIYPRSKAALNEAHIRELAMQSGPQRTKCRDALTLFDECGVILAYTDPSTVQALCQREWKKIFWERRGHWGQLVWPFLFGHALYEKALAPYVGMTGHTLVVRVEEEFFNWDTPRQCAFLDTRLASIISEQQGLSEPRRLQPLPILGVPGWYDKNHHEKFFDNTHYFRPLRPRY